MSGKATICQVCCWVNICYLEKNPTSQKDSHSKKKTGKKPQFLLLTKLVKSCFCLSLLHKRCSLSGWFIYFYSFSSCINSPSINVRFYRKNFCAIWQTQLFLASPVRLNTQHLSFAVVILVFWTVTISLLLCFPPITKDNQVQGEWQKNGAVMLLSGEG